MTNVFLNDWVNHLQHTLSPYISFIIFRKCDVSVATEIKI
jgi:hypothetical protein